MKPLRAFTAIAFLFVTGSTLAQVSGGTPVVPSTEQVNAIYPKIEKLYIDLHRNPELAFHEQRTAAELAQRVKAHGYDVTTGVGGTGIVAILKNGSGPTAMLRTELDALPIEEKTGLPFASTVKTKNAAGETIPVMHACGHDLHMSAWVGTAELMAQNRQRWHGTLMLVGQPAEEVSSGAAAMLKDGLFTRFPKPNYPCRCMTTQTCQRAWWATTPASSVPPMTLSRSRFSAGAGTVPFPRPRSIPS